MPSLPLDAFLVVSPDMTDYGALGGDPVLRTEILMRFLRDLGPAPISSALIVDGSVEGENGIPDPDDLVGQLTDALNSYMASVRNAGKIEEVGMPSTAYTLSYETTQKHELYYYSNNIDFWCRYQHELLIYDQPGTRLAGWERSEGGMTVRIRLGIRHGM